MTTAQRHIYLIGLPGSGKSTVAPILARRLGWTWVDLDTIVVERTGTSIPDLFAQGEPAFRRAEAEALAEIARRERPHVVATGGGVVLATDNRTIMRETGALVALRVSPDVAAERLSVPGAEKRPLLAGDLTGVLLRLYRERARYYDKDVVDGWIDTNTLTPEQVADRLIQQLNEQGVLDGVRVWQTIDVPLPRDPHTITVGWGARVALPDIVRAATQASRAVVVTDSAVHELPGARATIDLLRARLGAVETIVMPAGEQHKTLERVERICDALIAAHAERGTPIVALGGGVVGDLAGFVAATYLRGVPLFQVPTTLLAQVDAAIGGKVGVNHPRAKNAIGAFYQPRAIVIDPKMLETLDERVYREGFGEIVKYGMALDADLFAMLEAQRDALLARDPPSLVPVIARCARLKTGIIAGDEREGGQRMLLNYGHTIGHALETVAGYGMLLHGEAVALGMAVEARIAACLGMIDNASVTRQDALCAAFIARRDLPIAVTAEAVLDATRLDKKTRAGRTRWALPSGIGSATVRDNVPDELALSILRDWLASQSQR